MNLEDIMKNNLQIGRPDLAKEWDYEKNIPLTPSDVTIGSSKKVWWRCEKGHNWQSVIANRVRWSGCPFCSGRKVCQDNCLKTKYPSLVEEWDYEKNMPLTPNDVMPGSSKKAWWRCKKGHSWESSIASRVKGSGCPICLNRQCLPGDNDLETIFPDIAKEWDNEKNSLAPNCVTPGSSKKVWWRCEKGHSWQAPVNARTKGSGCPYCQGFYVTIENSLEKCYPDLAKLWDYEENFPKKPSEVAKSSSCKVAWKCENGHQWEARISDLTSKGILCPYCSGKRVSERNSLEKCYPEIAEEWDYSKNGKLRPSEVSYGSSKSVWWKCPKGHSWKSVIGNRTSNGTGCPQCNNRSTSFPEQTIFYYCKQVYPEAESRRKDIIGMELDVYIPSIRTAIEYDGARWHNNEDTQRREQKKDDLCKKNNIRLVRIMEEGIENIHSNEIICIHLKKGKKELERGVYQLIKVLDASIKLDIDLKRDEQKIREIYWHQEELNSLANVYPEIAKEWDRELNGGMTPYQFMPKSSYSAWWRCEKGHTWQSTIAGRTAGHGCPYCMKKLASNENNLLTNFPDIAVEWDYEKNHGITPRNVLPYSTKTVWWKCEKGHTWQSTINARTKEKRKCPYCMDKKLIWDNSLEATFPDLVREWDYRKNGDLLPKDCIFSSHEEVWWQCPKGHCYKKEIRKRTKLNQGCPYCARKKILEDESFGSMYPKLLKEWDCEKNQNISPYMIAPKSSKKVCDDNSLQRTHPEIAKEWDYDKNGEITPNDVTAGSGKIVWWRCSKGHSWQEKIFYRTRTKTHLCPICRMEKK